MSVCDFRWRSIVYVNAVHGVTEMEHRWQRYTLTRDLSADGQLRRRFPPACPSLWALPLDRNDAPASSGVMQLAFSSRVRLCYRRCFSAVHCKALSICLPCSWGRRVAGPSALHCFRTSCFPKDASSLRKAWSIHKRYRNFSCDIIWQEKCQRSMTYHKPCFFCHRCKLQQCIMNNALW